MRMAQSLKPLLLTGWALAGLLLLFSPPSVAENAAQDSSVAGAVAGEYAGSEACKACHTEEYENFLGTPHHAAASSRFENDMRRGCESCHGPGRAHVLAETKRREAMELGQEVPDPQHGLIRSFRGLSPKDLSDTCLECHAGTGEEHVNYRRGEHWRNDVGCTDCHDPHGMPRVPDRLGSQTFVDSATRHKPDWGSEMMLRESEPQLCINCHNEMRAQFTMPFRHRVLEGSMNCSDCHNPHGGFESRQMRLAAGADAACVKCHTDKQGPFTFEHAPLKLEGCASCHNPHGSANPRLLRRADVFQLCIECHSDVGGVGAPNTPSFHNLAQEKWRNCTTCHVKVHGSQTHPLFFR